jgi:hypothetical protein
MLGELAFLEQMDLMVVAIQFGLLQRPMLPIQPKPPLRDLQEVMRFRQTVQQSKAEVVVLALAQTGQMQVLQAAVVVATEFRILTLAQP